MSFGFWQAGLIQTWLSHCLTDNRQIISPHLIGVRVYVVYMHLCVQGVCMGKSQEDITLLYWCRPNSLETDYLTEPELWADNLEQAQRFSLQRQQCWGYRQPQLSPASSNRVLGTWTHTAGALTWWVICMVPVPFFFYSIDGNANAYFRKWFGRIKSLGFCCWWHGGFNLEPLPVSSPQPSQFNYLSHQNWGRVGLKCMCQGITLGVTPHLIFWDKVSP